MGFGGDGSQPSSSNSVTRPGLSDSGMHTSRVQPLDVLIWPPAESPLGPLEASEQHNPEVYQSCTIDQLLQRYKFGNVLGVGGFAVVKRAVDLRTNEQVAIKIVEKCR